MIIPKDLFDILINNDISFFTGVPDSTIKDFCAYVTDNVSSENHVINANEGSAVALAAGYYLATKKISLVYMQNSGLGNAINPLLSLADPEVYGIPMLLMIGWRGEPGKKDESQHAKDGKITLKMLELMDISYAIIGDSIQDVKKIVEGLCCTMREKKCPCALVVRRNAFEKYALKNIIETNFPLKREEAIKIVMDQLDYNSIIVSTTGMTSREVFEYREHLKQGHQNDFLAIGSMGHCSQIALGIALKKPAKSIYCFDGDGSVIMHMGSLATLGIRAPQNFKHIIFNNGSHDSVGGQPTFGFEINFRTIAKGCGYKLALTVQTPGEIKEAMSTLSSRKGPVLLEIKVNKGARENLGRPTVSPSESKNIFMGKLLN